METYKLLAQGIDIRQVFLVIERRESLSAEYRIQLSLSLSLYIGIQHHQNKEGIENGNSLKTS